MTKTPCNIEGLKKGAWTTEEDKKLIDWIKEHGEGGWRTLPQRAGIYIYVVCIFYLLALLHCLYTYIYLICH